MASGTPSAPINSSRGPRIRPPAAFNFPLRPPRPRLPPPTYAHTILLREKICGGGVKTYPVALLIIRGGIIIRAGAGGPKLRKKNPQTITQCRKYPNPYLYTLSQTIPYLYTLNRTIPYLNTLSRTTPYLNTLSRTIPYLNTLKKNPNLTQNRILVGSQSESSTKKP